MQSPPPPTLYPSPSTVPPSAHARAGPMVPQEGFHLLGGDRIKGCSLQGAPWTAGRTPLLVLPRPDLELLAGDRVHWRTSRCCTIWGRPSPLN